MTAYYNEIDKFAAAWLRNLIAAGHIAPGDVDERDIRDVRPDDLRGYTQCHFFAGIGGWSHALRLAGWPDRRPVWTGSCPCQPFSSASRGRGARFGSEGHLWPAWRELVASNRPRTVFGEQVAQAADWHSVVSDDLEALGYAFGSAYLPAVGVGLDHIRHRFYFVGYADGEGKPGCTVHEEMARVSSDRSLSAGLVSSHGFPARVAIMRAFGNAIVPELAAEVIGAWLDAEADQHLRLAFVSGIFA